MNKRAMTIEEIKAMINELAEKVTIEGQELYNEVKAKIDDLSEEVAENIDELRIRMRDIHIELQMLMDKVSMEGQEIIQKIEERFDTIAEDIQEELDELEQVGLMNWIKLNQKKAITIGVAILFIIAIGAKVIGLI